MNSRVTGFFGQGDDRPFDQKLATFMPMLKASLWKHKWVWIASVAALLTWTHFFKVCWNVSTSIDYYQLFVVAKQDHDIHREDYIGFTWHGAGPYKKGLTFGKIVKGMPGDVVTVKGRDFYINGKFVATAKEKAKTGQTLKPGLTGVIPPGHYFVYAPSPDSLDSRYAITGWIKAENVIGKAIPIF